MTTSVQTHAKYATSVHKIHKAVTVLSVKDGTVTLRNSYGHVYDLSVSGFLFDYPIRLKNTPEIEFALNLEEMP